MVWIMIVKGMYGLKQAGIIANQKLRAHLKLYGYKHVRHMLVVNGFLIQYMSLINASHLINVLKQKFNITIDWEANIYIGIT